MAMGCNVGCELCGEEIHPDEWCGCGGGHHGDCHYLLEEGE
jgi:hypothetical protein